MPSLKSLFSLGFEGGNLGLVNFTLPSLHSHTLQKRAFSSLALSHLCIFPSSPGLARSSPGPRPFLAQFLARSSPGPRPASPGPRPVLARSLPGPRLKQSSRQTSKWAKEKFTTWDVPGILPGHPGPLGVFKKFVQTKFVLLLVSRT